jgi:hypothetical protein
MSTEKGQELASRLNLGDVTDWRLHWLICRLSGVKHDMATANFAGGLRDLPNGTFGQFLGRVKRIEEDYLQIRRETQLMLGADYSNEIDALFDSLPNHPKYLDSLAEAKAKLQKVADDMLFVEARHLRGCIENAHQALT